MRLHGQGRVQTGIDMFDTSLGAMTIWQDAPGGPLLLASSGRHGGMSAWRVTAAGTLILQDTVGFDANGLNAARDHLVLAELQGEMIAFFGVGSTAFWGHVINPDGTFGVRRQVGFERVTQEIAAGHDGFVPLWALMQDTVPDGFANSTVWTGTRGVARTDDGALLLVSSFENALHVLPDAGGVQQAGGSMGLAAPTGLAAFADAGYGGRAVVAGAGGSSLSVLRAGAQGFVPVEHVTDTASTAFYRVQAISGVQVQAQRGPLDLVLVGGADHGVSLFALTPEGWLIWLDTYFDTALTGLHNVATLQTVVHGDRLSVAATSGRDPGISLLTLSVSGLGGLVNDGQGGAGDDIIIARPGVTTLTGGGGRNLFVIRSQPDAITIADFSAGLDRLDLSAWSMLRHVSQLEITPGTGGARIVYRGHEVHLFSKSGQALGAEDIFPHGLEGPDRVMVLSHSELYAAAPEPAPDPEPNLDPEPNPDPEPQPDPNPDPAPPDAFPTGDGRVALRDMSGRPLPDALVNFTLETGERLQILSNGAGVAGLPDLPLARLDATRPWAPATGDPNVTARDALDVLRLAVGLNPSFGPATAQNFIAADINGDGRVTALDALDVLRAAVGLWTDHPPRWVFFDADTEWNSLALSTSNTVLPQGLALDPAWEGGDLAMTGVLLGYMSLPT